MPDEEIELELDDQNNVEKRIRSLSEKVKLASGEKEDLRKKLEEEQQKSAALEKEHAFLSSFGEQTTKYPDAISFRDQIKERVLKGYSMDDATVAVLNQEGKLFKKEIPHESPAGGSATITPQSGSEKKVSDMSRDERRNALLEAEKRGDLGVN